jgi:hypothetical protein
MRNVCGLVCRTPAPPRSAPLLPPAVTMVAAATRGRTASLTWVLSVIAWLRKLPKTPLPAWLSRWGLFPVLSVIRDLGSLRFLSFGVIPLVKGLEFSHQVFVTEESLHVCPILIFAGWHTELVEVHIHE